MGEWYSASKNEYFFFEFNTYTHVQINTQRALFDEEFEVFKKYDDWHKFGPYFSKADNNDVIYVYNHGKIFETDCSGIAVASELEQRVKKA
jgi:hypothetical protein